MTLCLQRESKDSPYKLTFLGSQDAQHYISHLLCCGVRIPNKRMYSPLHGDSQQQEHEHPVALNAQEVHR